MSEWINILKQSPSQSQHVDVKRTFNSPEPRIKQDMIFKTLLGVDMFGSWGIGSAQITHWKPRL